MIPQLLVILAVLLPQVDQAPAAIQGPLTDAIAKRIDTFSERVEAWQNDSTLAQERFEKVLDGRFTELFQSMHEAAQERKGLIESIRVAAEDRKGLLSRLSEMRESLAEAREESRQARLEAREARREAAAQWAAQWHPLQNLIDRLNGFVWKLIYLVVSLGVLVLLTLALVGWIYAKLKSKLLSIV